MVKRAGGLRIRRLLRKARKAKANRVTLKPFGQGDYMAMAGAEGWGTDECMEGMPEAYEAPMIANKPGLRGGAFACLVVDSVGAEYTESPTWKAQDRGEADMVVFQRRGGFKTPADGKRWAAKATWAKLATPAGRKSLGFAKGFPC